jgi:hypothetical protein
MQQQQQQQQQQTHNGLSEYMETVFHTYGTAPNRNRKMLVVA